ncbi:hypothetical protein [Guggenheimella bovis]
MLYQGIIITEALREPWVINDLMIEEAKISKENGQHYYEVRLTLDDIGQVASSLEKGWFFHFWNDQSMIVCFGEGKQFFMDREDRSTWTDAILYGSTMGFTEDELNFEPYKL